ncbi:hypothetical protein CAPTEDRAFT_185512 [Capitella teleta]|uniref:Neurotransmitter-gated ion-channel ligand-binding domain-containing protein n=1 Tax=Capitella teleta TaxID=283909 RepID=R7TQR6_CAPTE|nr:hypothetical protein CAPTEDRAFT_185512 [Capitella teleta]|eukprot:ELT96268.1 hypothetical protein CAPTEDRAFT_185512 [Capitella teleta]
MKLILVVFLAGIEMTLGSTTEFIRDLIHPSKYDKNDLPTSGQTNVSIGVYLNNIVLNEKKSLLVAVATENYNLQMTFGSTTEFFTDLIHLSVCFPNARTNTTLGSTTEFIRDLIHPSKYDKNDLPTSGQTNVSIGVYLNNIVLNEKKSSMKVLMYLRQAWKDPRMAHNSNQRQRVPSEFIDQIWRPDTFFRNARTIQLKQEMTDERLMTIDKNGSIWFVQR